MENELYFEDMVELYHTGEHRGNLKPPTVTSERVKQGDGDRIRIDLKIENGKIITARYSGSGSVLSQGISAYLCYRIEGMTVQEAAAFDVTREIRFSITPNRQGCATLGLSALGDCLNAYSET